MVYSAFVGWLWLGSRALARIPRPAPLPDNPSLPRITVVVPLRNEENHALRTLEALSRQNYIGWHEIICVDDRSTDATPAILSRFCADNPRFRQLTIGLDEPTVTSGKKRALARGFAQARGDILMTTDADCLPPANWMTSMARSFASGADIVQGPKSISGAPGVLTQYQQTEVFALVSIEAASFAMGKPVLASAPSLAYRKDLYEKTGGFEGLEDYVSGDDDLLVHKMMTIPGVRVTYNLDPDASVVTSPVLTWKELLQQRARWASNGAHYDQKGFVALLACIYAFYWWLLLSPLFAALGWVPWKAFAIPLALKIGLNCIFLKKTSILLRQEKAFRHTWWAEILHIPIVLAAVIIGHLGWYRWK